VTRRPCLACANERARETFVVREMMLGLGDPFQYWECAECGAIQIADPPEDLARYYRGVGYYSFHNPRRGYFKATLKRERARFAFTGRGTAGRLLTKWYGYPQIVGWLREWIANAGLTADQEILDVGCGTAPHFLDLMDVGFSRLTGVDPYIDDDIDFGRGVRVKKLRLTEVQQDFDFVMLHHSFEHMPDPRSAMHELIRIVRPGKFVLIRTPVAGSFAWRTYRSNWVQLDAPRHFFIPSVASISVLARDAGFEVVRVVFDSDDLQFWGSEQYARGISMMDAKWRLMKPRPGLFTAAQLKDFRKRALRLNETGEGDSAAFYLRRPETSHSEGRDQ
jgi:SAM-dependent methyltransferase